MTRRKYPESFFKDLTKFAEKDILPKQAQLDTEYADYLISLILASPSASTKTLITKIISFYYKENKTPNIKKIKHLTKLPARSTGLTTTPSLSRTEVWL